MDADSSGDEREIRAARNQALFRAVNEKLTDLNQAFVSAADTFVIACECADATCVQTLEIQPAVYAQVRAHPRRFVVLSGHVYAEIEGIVAQTDGYLIVEKVDAPGRVAEELA
jgi:5-bromo-4-chloroindolyl phosphate hydrolysis protein